MSDSVKIFVGFDPRQPVAYNVLQSSLHRHSKRRLQIEPLILDKLPIKRRGLTEFTYSRFLVPWLCDYEGAAIFMDADIVVTGDIGELIDAAEGASCVQVMQAQQKFEWASVMLFNCARCEILTPDYIDDKTHPLLDFAWAVEMDGIGGVGNIPPEWNYCVGYEKEREAKLYHYTQGIPVWSETRGNPEDQHWMTEYGHMVYTVDWKELMGNSIHAKPVLQRFLGRYGIGLA